ncbi:hypothetical protein H8M03_08870 [Sphingomonas sabuli]|uniref:Uncharacterized protein n=1 Tax=Sphingomonas sabuli TaxID=2764186 RepID=A0A7G9L0I7_9SPHN|nr:hypothetical protein [Sphingomonas sabuli]QNM82136.1 hypothetical protein H8M03_08870 [Sphingomonas sabuli]
MFLFEFAVVVVGVLVAQGLANWVQARSEREEAGRLLDDLTVQVSEFRRDLNYWDRVGPCLRAHVSEIKRTAAGAGTMSAAQIGRPALPQPSRLNFSGDEWQKVRRLVPQEKSTSFTTLAGTIETYQAFISDTAQQWAKLRLLDGNDGTPSPADRSQVRLAATIIDNNIRWMMFQQRAGSAQTLATVGMAGDKRLPDSARFVDRCGLLTDWR